MTNAGEVEQWTVAQHILSSIYARIADQEDRARLQRLLTLPAVSGPRGTLSSSVDPFVGSVVLEGRPVGFAQRPRPPILGSPHLRSGDRAWHQRLLQVKNKRILLGQSRSRCAEGGGDAPGRAFFWSLRRYLGKHRWLENLFGVSDDSFHHQAVLAIVVLLLLRTNIIIFVIVISISISIIIIVISIITMITIIIIINLSISISRCYGLARAHNDDAEPTWFGGVRHDGHARICCAQGLRNRRSCCCLDDRCDTTMDAEGPSCRLEAGKGGQKMCRAGRI
eukprot:s745_g6.t2